MHSYHIFFQKGRGLDWSFICQNHGEKSKNTSNCSFFSTSSPFLSSKSFFHHPLQVCDRFQTGWEGRTMCCDPQYRPQAQRLASTPSPSRPWGGAWPPPLCPPPLSWSPPSTTTTTRINRSVTPYKRSTKVHASQYSAPPTMTGHVVQEWERRSQNKMESSYG